MCSLCLMSINESVLLCVCVETQSEPCVMKMKPLLWCVITVLDW